jgi:hypothetical protein
VKPGSTADAVVAIASLGLLCVSFLPVVSVSVGLPEPPASSSMDAWHSYGSCGMLIALAGVALWGVARFQTIPLAPGRNWALIAGGMIVLGTALVFVRAIVYASESLNVNVYGQAQVQASTSLGYGMFLLLIFGITAAVTAAWRLL